MWPATRCACFALLCFGSGCAFLLFLVRIWRRYGRLIVNCAQSRFGVVPTTMQAFHAIYLTHYPESEPSCSTAFVLLWELL